jgi:hypothetical protein
MMKRHLLCAAAMLSASGALAQSAPAKAPDPYAPGLGDFMTAYVQPHHIKLWEAGSAGNWPLAAYEANELRETFEDVTTYQAVWHDLPIDKMVKAILEPRLDAVDQAIKGRDKGGFAKTYAELTAGCNQCHRAAKHEFIVIQVPKGAAYPDQGFQAK